MEAQSVKINEVVSSNSLFLDEEGDTPDWLELFNSSAEPIIMKGFTLTDNKDDTAKWVFPDIVLPGGHYLLVWSSGKNRISVGYPKTLITETDTFNYLIPTSAMPDDWMYTGYDDSGWETGGSGFGYGDGDDLTEIPSGTISVFLRKEFNIEDISVIQELILDIDYDDGFVAYINGYEIGRANVHGTPPSFDASAFAGHEANLYSGGLTERFVTTNVNEILVNGINTLAIQSHNVGSSSSDLSLIPFLSIKTSMPVDYGMDPPEILQLRPSYLHTNFKISSGGETLYLYNSTGILLDSLCIPELTGDVSYGILPGINDYRLFESPSPGAINSGTTYLGKVTDEVQFSHPGGISGPITLSLGGVEAPAEIHYTLDATEPDESSPVYMSPITIDSNTVVRAAVFQPEYLPSGIISRSFIIGTQHELPVVTIVTDPYNFFDPDYGMYAFGSSYKEDFPFFGANFWEDWERPLNFSFYDPEGNLGISFNAGVKIYGGWSRGHGQKSLSIFARGRYGTSSIEYPFFPDNPYSSYQAIVLRNSGNDWLNTNFRDAALTGLLRGSGLEYQAYQPVVAYLNGEYWGIYNLREKINEHFLASKGNVSTDEINLLEFNGRVIYGSNEGYLELLNFLNNNSLTTAMNYEYMTSRIDIDNFIMYQIAQIYFNNRDWPGNNIKFWNHAGGKWRWIVFDTDFGFGIWDRDDWEKNTLAFALDGSQSSWPNPAWSTLFLRKFMENHRFRNKFINKFADELNTRFSTSSVWTHLDTLAGRIYPEIEAHYQRWGSDLSRWTENFDNMKFFAENRPAAMRTHIRNQFGLPAVHKLVITNSMTAFGTVQVNSVNIDASRWEGYYFEGIPIKVRAVPAPGYRLAYWNGSIESSSTSLEIDMSTNVALTPHFEPGSNAGISLVINEINYKSPEDLDAGDWVEIFNPGTTTLDLAGWQLKDDNDSNSFVFPDQSIIYAEDFLVVTRDQTAFQKIYPYVNYVIGDFDFGLSSTGDAVRLYDPGGELVDEVYYHTGYPWPTQPNGMGPTLELLDPSLDNALPGNWAAMNPHGSPGAPNITVTSLSDGLTRLENVMEIFPNPAGDHLHLSLNMQTHARIRISLHNLNGKELGGIFEGPVAPGEYTFNHTVDQLPAGLYLIKMESNNLPPVTRRVLKGF